LPSQERMNSARFTSDDPLAAQKSDVKRAHLQKALFRIILHSGKGTLRA
jgi:hypothetical protein